MNIHATPSFTPTQEQESIIAAARETRDNLMIQALAGAAKTTTLRLIAEALPTTPILSLAFNKRIAADMQSRLPANATAQTLNSLGHRAWGRVVGGRLSLSEDKTSLILRDIIRNSGPDDREELWSSFSDITRAVRTAKNSGWVPDGEFPELRPLIGDEQFFASLDEAPSDLTVTTLRSLMIESYRQSLAGRIDFDDQILMPSLHPRAVFDYTPLVMVDEAQDLSSINHEMLGKIVKRRVIVVGDPYQSIYAFRGADERSMDTMRDRWNCTVLRLTTSFRCPIAVVREARWRAPEMRYPAWAKEGEVTALPSWSAGDIPDGATILCRNNAPLFSAAVRLLKSGRYPEIVGNDIGKRLITIMKKLGPAETPQDAALYLLTEWLEKNLTKSRDESKTRDLHDCCRIFIEANDTLGNAITYAEHLMASKGRIQLMTGHKSKGLEFPEVFILDCETCNPKSTQDRNLLYVMQTRAQERLVYIASSGWSGDGTV